MLFIVMVSVFERKEILLIFLRNCSRVWRVDDVFAGVFRSWRIVVGCVKRVDLWADCYVQVPHGPVIDAEGFGHNL